MAKRIENFNEVVGVLFAQLYEAFPVEHDLDLRSLGEALKVEVTVKEWAGPPIINFGPMPNGDNTHLILNSAIEWLKEEGFVRTTRGATLYGVVLTAKALTVLNATPTALGGRTLGQRLSSAAGSAGTEAGRAAIGELVGQVIGGFARSL